jgi:hypothetical protein
MADANQAAANYPKIGADAYLWWPRPSRTAGVVVAARRPAPEGWQRDLVGLSISLRPVSHVLPDQGCTIHIASTLDGTELVIDVAHDFCLAHRIPFKFIHSRAAALAGKSKYTRSHGYVTNATSCTQSTDYVVHQRCRAFPCLEG